MPKVHYGCSSQELPEQCCAEFEALRAALPPEDQRNLDLKLARWIETINALRPKGGFGIKGAQELFMCLQGFLGAHEVNHERTPEHAVS